MWFLVALAGRLSTSAWLEDRLADHDALKRMANGDAEAVGELYDRLARPVYSLALRILRNSADAEDIVQDVFSQAWRQAARYDATRGTVAAWLLTLTRSRAIDRLRSRRARPDDVAAEPDPNVPDAGVAADLQIQSAQQIELVRAALEELPPLQRIVLELAYYEGLTHVEIAARLEQPLGTVKTRIRQAMLRLRESLAGAR